LVNQSLAGGLARAGLPQTALWLVLVLVLLVFVVVGVRGAASAPLAMVITAGFGLIASPISWGHHWVYVVPAIIVLAANGITRRQVGWLFAAVALVAVYRVAAFLDVGGTEWAPVRLLAENSYVVTGVALLLIYAGPDVCRLLLSRPALRSWRSTATRRVAALPPPPPCPVADASRSPR
jgi:alpha-1,2-mannosyltransferase